MKKKPLKSELFQSDLSQEYFDTFAKDDFLAVDCEMMGLNPKRDRLCLVQICDSANNSALVQILPGQTEAPLLKKLFENEKITKVFHFARMDTLFLKYRLNIQVNSIFCTKISSKLVRTYTDKHGLKELIREFFDEVMDKKNQSSDWGKQTLTKDQLEYATEDVRYLIALAKKLTDMMIREERFEYAKKSFDFLPVLVDMDFLDLKGVFEH